MSKIYEFNPEVYPLKLWFAISPSLQQLQSRFRKLDDDYCSEKGMSEDTIKPYWGAYRVAVVEKKTNKHGSLIVIQYPEHCDVATLCHEVSHAYDDFVELLGLPEVGETRAYLQEWMFSKCYNVWDGNIRSTNK